MPPADVPAMTSTVTVSGCPGPGQVRQGGEIDRLAVVIARFSGQRARGEVPAGIKVAGLPALAAGPGPVEGPGGPDQLEDLLGEAVHVDRQRNPAVAHQAEANFFGHRTGHRKPPFHGQAAVNEPIVVSA